MLKELADTALLRKVVEVHRRGGVNPVVRRIEPHLVANAVLLDIRLRLLGLHHDAAGLRLLLHVIVGIHVVIEFRELREPQVVRLLLRRLVMEQVAARVGLVQNVIGGRLIHRAVRHQRRLGGQLRHEHSGRIGLFRVQPDQIFILLLLHRRLGKAMFVDQAVQRVGVAQFDGLIHLVPPIIALGFRLRLDLDPHAALGRAPSPGRPCRHSPG